jgi:hypothetical protein
VEDAGGSTTTAAPSTTVAAVSGSSTTSVASGRSSLPFSGSARGAPLGLAGMALLVAGLAMVRSAPRYAAQRP